MTDSKQIPEHESAVRRMISDCRGTPYYPLKTLDEARQYDDGIAILQGDWGGQIYAVIPAQMILCSMNTLQQLLLDLDTIAWDDNEGAFIYYERKPIGAGVAGGMGGGRSTGDIWIHPEFDSISQQIQLVVAGKQQAIIID